MAYVSAYNFIVIFTILFLDLSEEHIQTRKKSKREQNKRAKEEEERRRGKNRWEISNVRMACFNGKKYDLKWTGVKRQAEKREEEKLERYIVQRKIVYSMNWIYQI